MVPVVILTNKEEDNVNTNTTDIFEITIIKETDYLKKSDSVETDIIEKSDHLKSIDSVETDKEENSEELRKSDISEKDKTEAIKKVDTTQIEKQTEKLKNTEITETEKKDEITTTLGNPKISIEEFEQTKYCIYSNLKIKCKNLNYYPDIKPTDISLEFPIKDSTKKYYCDSINENIIEIKIPPEVISGNIILFIEKLDFIYEFSLDIVKEIKINLKENIKYTFGLSIVINNENITNFRNNDSIIYSFIAPARGIYDVELSSSIAVKDPGYLYADIDYDLEMAIKKGRNVGEIVKKSSSTRYTDFQKTIHGSFYLEENKEYFLKIAFIKAATLFTYNVNGIRIIPNENQNKQTFGMGYAIYQIEFSNEATYPFYKYWAMTPNYITIQNEYVEFYYNQMTYDKNFGVRQYKGAELTTNFVTIKDGWYGYKVYLTDDYPKNANTTIITQIFNTNRVNTWAGHLHTKQQNLWLSYRSAALDRYETDVDLGKIEWNKWYNVVIYFKVGQNNKGKIKLWLSQNELKEDEPFYETEGINFGFGSWIDDETLDNTKIEANGKTNQILCKFGLYTWDGGDKIIRFKNLTVLEYNPEGAFDIVNPCKDK